MIMENIKKTRQIKSEAVIQRCSVKKVFLEILQNSQENTSAKVSFLILVQPPGLRILAVPPFIPESSFINSSAQLTAVA